MRPAYGEGDTARLSGQMSMVVSYALTVAFARRRLPGTAARYSFAGNSMILFTASVASYTDT